MARPLKKGIDYFPLEVSIDEDNKFFDLFEDFGTDKGLGLVIMLLSDIYKNDGYYHKWSDSICKKFSRRKQLDREDVKRAVAILTGTCKDYSEPDDDELFFDRKLFKEESILTSKAIQKRFFLAAERRKDREIIKQYFLLNYEKGEVKTGTKAQGITRVDVIEESFYITLEKKKIPFRFKISGEIGVNANINKVNDDTNTYNVEDNVCSSTQTKTEQNKTNQNKEEQRREEKNKIKEEEKKTNDLMPYNPHANDPNAASNFFNKFKSTTDAKKIN